DHRARRSKVTQNSYPVSHKISAKEAHVDAIHVPELTEPTTDVILSKSAIVEVDRIGLRPICWPDVAACTTGPAKTREEAVIEGIETDALNTERRGSVII